MSNSVSQSELSSSAVDDSELMVAAGSESDTSAKSESEMPLDVDDVQIAAKQLQAIRQDSPPNTGAIRVRDASHPVQNRDPLPHKHVRGSIISKTSLTSLELFYYLAAVCWGVGATQSAFRDCVPFLKTFFGCF
jgi:hypothetical protein